MALIDFTHRCGLLLVALLAWSTTTALGASPVSKTRPESAPASSTSNTPSLAVMEVQWSFHAKGGMSFFSGSRSKTLEHLFKPSMRLAAMAHLDHRTGLGLEAVGVLSDSEGYRLIGMYVAGRTMGYNGDVFRLHLLYGLGVGTAPKILSPQLDTSADMAAWAHWGLGFYWAFPGTVASLGLELIHEQITVITSAVVLSIHP